MILNPFSYSAPETIEEAVALLSETGSALFTGDQAYVGRAKSGVSKTESLISLRNVPGLKSVIRYDNQLEIGSAVTFADLLHDSVVCSVPVLAEALGAVKDPHFKNHSNVGGAIHHITPAHGPVLTAFLILNGKLNVTGPLGDRQIWLETYLSDYSEGTLSKGEIIKSISLTLQNSASGSFHFIDYLKAGKIVCGVAVLMHTDNGVISQISMAVCGCVAVPTRLKGLESALIGMQISKENIGAALDKLSEEELAISSSYVSNQSYLLHLLKVLITRALFKK
jgi:carbon-monoxide dehydrogenase medium subunit